MRTVLCAALTPRAEVADPKVLGTWAGLCKIDREGKPRKVIGASCVVVCVVRFVLRFSLRPCALAPRALKIPFR